MFCCWPIILLALCGCCGNRRRCNGRGEEVCGSNPLEHLPTNVYRCYDPRTCDFNCVLKK